MHVGAETFILIEAIDHHLNSQRSILRIPKPVYIRGVFDKYEESAARFLILIGNPHSFCILRINM